MIRVFPSLRRTAGVSPPVILHRGERPASARRLSLTQANGRRQPAGAPTTLGPTSCNCYWGVSGSPIWRASSASRDCRSSSFCHSAEPSEIRPDLSSFTEATSPRMRMRI